jgi:ribonuclease BN (tRNA processing enzyme)
VRDETWRLDGVAVTAAPVTHPGTTVGYRLEEGGRSLAFIPDNELGLDPESGLALAAGADVLLHDAQYTADEYATRTGWGHSSIDDFAAFVRASEPGRAVMFHHDPNHSDAALEEMHAEIEQQTGRRIDVAAVGLLVVESDS